MVIFIYFQNSNNAEKSQKSNQDNQTSQSNLSTGSYQCQLVRVIDGDSLTASCLGEIYSIRLMDMDAPELGQAPWGEQSKQYLVDLLPSQITLIITEKDRYQRYLATVMVDNQDIALQMIEAGYAVVYWQYTPPNEYKAAMRKAKAKQQGVWSEAGLHQDPQLFRRLAF